MIVPQEPPLFSTTIRENIAYGCTRTDELPSLTDIKAAAREAHCDEFIDAFPEGYIFLSY